jgi:hypothetical protein
VEDSVDRGLLKHRLKYICAAQIVKPLLKC